MGVRDWLAKATGAGEIATASGRALVEERYRALQRQIPLLYVVALANFIGIHLVIGEPLDTIHSPITLLVLLVLLRLGHWVRVRRRVYPPEIYLRELRKTWLYALIISLGFSVWGQQWLGTGIAQGPAVVLFGSLAAVGCAYGLSSFPSAARLPLLLLGLPLAARLIWSGTPDKIGMGISLALVVLLILRLLGLQNESFTQVVKSRSSTMRSASGRGRPKSWPSACPRPIH